MDTIYLDSCLVIYLIEGEPEVAEKTRLALTETPSTLSISGLVRLECLVGPVKSGKPALVEQYRRFFDTLNLLPTSEEAFDFAAELRARTSLKLPDALHLAVAEVSGCAEFWTGDLGINFPSDMMRAQLRTFNW